MEDALLVIFACAFSVFLVCLYITPSNSDALSNMFPEVYKRISICGVLSMVVWVAVAIAFLVIVARGE